MCRKRGIEVVHDESHAFSSWKGEVGFFDLEAATYPHVTTHVTTVLSQRCSKSGDGHRINGDVVEDEDRYERQSQQEPRETVQCANLSLRYICIVELRTHGYPGTVGLQCGCFLNTFRGVFSSPTVTCRR